MKKIAAAFVATAAGIEKNGVITLDDNGVILNVETGVQGIDSLPNTEYYNGVLIPGMIDCHCHLEYSYVKGMIPRGAGLPEFIRSIIEIKQTHPLTDDQKAAPAMAWDAKLYAQGVVAVGDHNNNDYVYDIKRNSRVYYHNFVELFDMDGEDADTTFHNGMKRVDESHKYGLAASIVPHACYTMADRLIGLTGGELTSNKGVKATGPVSTHFKESVVLGGADERERMLSHLSPQRDNIILVHCIYATAEDLDAAIAKFGDRLTVSPCPMSNLFIEKRIGDYDLFRSRGVNIAMGTDSLSSNDTLSMAQEMATLQRCYPNIPTDEIIRMATANGARALGISDWAGSFEKGKKPGLVLLEGMNLKEMVFTDTVTSRRII